MKFKEHWCCRIMFSHVSRRAEKFIGKRIVKKALTGKRKRGWPVRRYMDRIREDNVMIVVVVKEGDALKRISWRHNIIR